MQDWIIFLTFACKMNEMLVKFSLLLLACLSVCAYGRVEDRDTFHVETLHVDSLPPLNIPRLGHNTFVVGDELVVVGGHTSGFVPTATAEYFSDVA